MRGLHALTFVSLAAIGCAVAIPKRRLASTSGPAAPRARTRAPAVELFFKGGEPWARRNCPGVSCEEWSLGDIKKSEMVFSPDGKRFAYVRQRAQAAIGRGSVSPARLLVRNLAGDPVNDFSV